jgi:hypothetical protein
MTRLGLLLNTIIISTIVVVSISSNVQEEESISESSSSSSSVSSVSPEALFRRANSEWRASSTPASRQWQPWMKYAASLEQLVDEQQQQNSNNKNDNKNDRIMLDIIGAYEAGILAMERDIYQRSIMATTTTTTSRQEEDVARDMARDLALSQLYTGYANLLTLLTPDACLQLALDPHTLLIGASTVTANSVPSMALCMENADNSARNAISLNENNVQALELLQSILEHVGNSGSNEQDDDDNDGSRSSMPRRNTEFVAELFDSFADSFDETVCI